MDHQSGAQDWIMNLHPTPVLWDRISRYVPCAYEKSSNDR
jgi:hypothetical protein